MTKSEWRNSATTDVLFPDDIEEYGPLYVSSPPLDAEEISTDTVQFGTVAKLDENEHQEDFLVCPRQLRSLIADAWRPDDGFAAFEVLSAEKGPQEDDEWSIEGRDIQEGDQL